MDTLRNALQTVCDLANQFLQNLDRRPDTWLVLTSLVDHDGSINQAARDKIVMTVYNITRDAFAGSSAGSYRAAAGSAAGLPVTSPALYLDVHLMFMANFTERGYADGLAALSRLIGFFQQTPVLNQQTVPGLDPSIGQLALELEQLTPVDVNYVMSMMGTRYLPSAFYKLRMVPFRSGVIGRTFPVTGAGSSASTPARAA